MAERTCPHCRGHLQEGEERCRWCGGHVPPEPVRYQPGDVIRIRNPFKGGHVEDVTVVAVHRGGYALEVRDSRGLVWGLIQPRDIVGPAQPARR